MIHFEEVSDEQLLAMHKRADLLDPTNPADAEFHHRVSTEMLARGIEHGHDNDAWTTAVIELDSSIESFTDATVEMPEDVVAEVAKQLDSPEWVRQTSLLTVDGLSVRFDTIHKSEIPVSKADGWTPPSDVRAAARQAVQWIEAGRAGDGFTAVGRNRARQLANGDTVSQADAIKMRAYFARHFVDKDAEDWGDKDNPTPGMVAWYAWGGDAGRAWVNRLLSDVSKAAYPMGNEDDLIIDVEDDIPTTPQRNNSLVSMLQILLMDVVTFYLTAHGFHWNVLGKNFQQFHELFGEIYEDALGSIDPLAENIRKLDAFAPFRLSQIVQERDAVEVDIEYGDGMPLASALYDANEHIIDCLMDTFDKASSERQQGVANFLADRLDMHQKWRWQLRSTLAEYDDAMYEQEMALLETLSSEDLEMFRRIAAALEAGEDPDEFVGKARGNAEVLRDYWRKDPKGKVGWGGGGDWTRCVAAVGKYMSSEEAKGYCALRHKEVNGFYPGDKRNRTQKSATPMVKHPGHPDQKVHAGGKSGAGEQVSAQDWRDLRGHISPRVASMEYNDAYGNAVERLNNGDDIEGRVNRQREGLASDLKQFREMKGTRSWVSESLAANIVNRQGFIDGATGAKRRIKRTILGDDVRFLGLLGGGGSHEFAKEADAEPMVKHPGHPDQKIHAGGKGRKNEPNTDGESFSPYRGKAREGMGDGIAVNDEDFAALQEGSAGRHIVGRTADGVPVFTPERQALHDQIIADALNGVPRSSNPTQVMLGGGPAAGKSHALDEGVLTGVPSVGGKGKPKDAVLVNPDDLKELLPEGSPIAQKADPSNWASFTHEESSYLAKRLTKAGQERKVDIVVDGTGNNSPASVRGKISQAQGAGYRVTGRYVTCATETAVRRSDERFQKTGRKVPEAILRKTHRGVSIAFTEVAGDFDDVQLVSTESSGKPVLVATGKRGRGLTIKNQAEYKAFLSKVAEQAGSSAFGTVE